MRPAALAGFALAAALVLAPRTALACRIDDSFPAFLALARQTQGLAPAARLAAFHQQFLPKTAGLYTPQAVGLAPGEKLDARALAEMAATDVQARQAAVDAQLRRTIPMIAAQFQSAFPDFRCDFAIYLAPTFRTMDAGGRIVDGRPALVFGPDMIAAIETPEQVPILVAHELFHRHHGRVGGFSDEDPEHTAIWRTLWTEGLATYVSARLNPDRSLREALLQPGDLEQDARPLLPQLAAELAADLDRTDAGLARTFFMYGDPAAKARGLPWRAGYYVGYRVAEDLARRHGLAELARLRGPALRREIGESLARLAAEGGQPATS